MAYVRRRGNQLSIVTGERNPDTKKVEQRILFTLYSKPEALEALGRGNDKHSAARFETLMKHAHPSVRFDWKALRKAMAADLDHLPDTYEYRESRLMERFRRDLVAFARALMLADPQHLLPAGTLIRENRAALEYLRELIAWRIETCGEREPNQWNSDNPFFWRFTLQGKEVPPDAEEHATGFWERRDLVRAEAAFKLLIEAFPTYAKGWNYLGLIALDRDDLALAEGHFRKTMEVGRKLLPRHIPRSSWWTDHKTRPYMRGLRNLTVTLIRLGRYEEASELADRLELECGDDLVAGSHRAAIAINVGQWKTAAESAARLREIWPEEGLLEALARFELGEHAAALGAFMRAALSRPRAVRLVLGLPSTPPKSSNEVEDHNAGVSLWQTLHGYLGKRAHAGRKFLTRVASDGRVAPLMARVEALRESWSATPGADRAVFDELTRIQTSGFAANQARALADLLPGGESARRPVERPARARRPSRGAQARRLQ